MIEIKLDKLIRKAIKDNVSDLHLNYEKHRSEIIGRRHKNLCFRIEDASVNKIYAYCKRLAHFDMSSYGAQTGIFKWIVNDFEYLIRFSAIDFLDHKNGVLRILNLHQNDEISVSVPRLDDQKDIFRILQQRTGITLFVGKTGSGKSTTMYNCLSTFNEIQIYSVENPIERHHPKWIQIETDDFEQALTQLLRHDPDIVVFGEVRSENDIKQLIRAGLSGHRVVATMHAGSVYQSIRRLCDLGASIYDLYDILKGVVYQTLEVKEGAVVVEYNIWNQIKIKRILKKMENEGLS